MQHLGLFEGIGGFSLAALWMGWHTVAWSEINPFCQKVLKYHFPEAEPLGDIKQIDFTKYAGAIDIITGGFPCQPYSLAGLRKGTEDERHLWPEMLRAIREIKPRWIVGENVFGIINWNGGVVFNEVQVELENEGYEVQAYILPAGGVNAPHKRDRVWFVAYSNKKLRDAFKSENSNPGFTECKEKEKRGKNWSGFELVPGIGNTTSFFNNGQGLEPAVISINDGVPFGLDGITISDWNDRSNEAYGNAIVPQVALQIFKAIQTYETL